MLLSFLYLILMILMDRDSSSQVTHEKTESQGGSVAHSASE